MKLPEELFSPRRTPNDFTRLNSSLHAKFNEYMFEHLEWVIENIPDGAMIQIEIDGDEAFNAWSRELVSKSVAENQPVFIARFLPVSGSQRYAYEASASDTQLHAAMAQQ